MAAGVVGCSSPALSEQARAEAVVWRGTYAMVADAPAVQWVEHQQLAGDGTTGRTLPGVGVVVACGPGCSDPIRATAYAHELAHWRCYLLTGDVDAAHSRCDWTLVERAERAMFEAGLD